MYAFSRYETLTTTRDFASQGNPFEFRWKNITQF